MARGLDTLCRRVLGWEPAISLEKGLALTYAWIEEQVRTMLRHEQGQAVGHGFPSLATSPVRSAP
jgi:hypothetical protein